MKFNVEISKELDNTFKANIIIDYKIVDTLITSSYRKLKHDIKVKHNIVIPTSDKLDFKVISGKQYAYYKGDTTLNKNNNFKLYGENKTVGKYQHNQFSIAHNYVYNHNSGVFDKKVELKHKNFSLPTMERIGQAIQDLKNSGVNIKTYQFLKIYHSVLDESNDEDKTFISGNVEKYIELSMEKARDKFSLLS